MKKIKDYLSGKFDQYEIYSAQSNSRSISFESNELKEISSKQSQGTAIRGVKKSDLTFASTSNTNPDKFINVVEELSEYPIFAPINFPGYSKKEKQVKLYSKDTYKFPNDYLIDQIKLSRDKILKLFPEALCDSGFNLIESESKLENSSDLEIITKQSYSGFYISVQVINNKDMLNIYDGYSSSLIINKDQITMITEKIIKYLKLGEKIVEPPKNGCPVVFTPSGLLQSIISPLLVSFNGSNIAKNLSKLSNKENNKIIDEKISIYDNPSIDYSPASKNYDDEGVPSDKFDLVKDGKFISGYYDLKSSKEAKKQTTGSAGRSINSQPMPTTSNIIMAKGKDKLDNIIKSIDDGILIDSLLGAGQGNELSGDFSANISLGYRIKNGKLIGRIKNTMLSGNAFDALSKINHLSLETENIFGTINLPYLCTNNVEISS
ncbi:MAG: hypothetical protein CL748_06505 [Chloroflexi bacterium]|nr:hypothetical protein [Chloroflexota bacterium]